LLVKKKLKKNEDYLTHFLSPGHSESFSQLCMQIPNKFELIGQLPGFISDFTVLVQTRPHPFEHLIKFVIIF